MRQVPCSHPQSRCLKHVGGRQKEPVDVLGENLRRIFLERGVDFFDNHPDITSTLASQDTSLKDDKATGEDMSSSEEEGSIQPMTTEELLHMRHEISQNLLYVLIPDLT